MTSATPSVSGFWGGIYFYPENVSEPVNFDAEFMQAAEMLSGNITETNTIDPDGGVLLASVIDGEITGSEIRFTKRYTNGSEKHDVRYVGTLSQDSNEISGQWSILTFTGTFVMTRDAGKPIETQTRRAHKRVTEPA